MSNAIITLDIETENIGYDIMEDNKRIISIQLMEGTETKIFYDGSKTDSIEIGKDELHSLIESGKHFMGFNIRNFDVPLIKKFLGMVIPPSQIIEISEMPAMDRVRRQIGKNKVSLIQACDVMGVGCSHKNLMDEKTEKFKQQPDVIEQAKIGARKWVDELGWGSDFSFNLALRKIAGGMAILEAFNEFVDSDGDTNSLFYDYAIGDLMSEKALYLKMK